MKKLTKVLEQYTASVNFIKGEGFELVPVKIKDFKVIRKAMSKLLETGGILDLNEASFENLISSYSAVVKESTKNGIKEVDMDVSDLEFILEVLSSNFEDGKVSKKDLVEENDRLRHALSLAQGDFDAERIRHNKTKKELQEVKYLADFSQKQLEEVLHDMQHVVGRSEGLATMLGHVMYDNHMMEQDMQKQDLTEGCMTKHEFEGEAGTSYLMQKTLSMPFPVVGVAPNLASLFVQPEKYAVDLGSDTEDKYLTPGYDFSDLEERFNEVYKMADKELDGSGLNMFKNMDKVVKNEIAMKMFLQAVSNCKNGCSTSNKPKSPYVPFKVTHLKEGDFEKMLLDAKGVPSHPLKDLIMHIIKNRDIN